MTNKIFRWFILMALFIWFLTSCTEEIGPCHDSEVQCKKLLELSKQTTGVESENYYQHYLAEKHILENCYDINGK